MKADLGKAVIERDALQDALHETRTTLTDVRAQRDGLDTDLKEARSAAKQLRKVSRSAVVKLVALLLLTFVAS